MKNIFGGENKSKKEQKLLETTLKTIISSTKEKAKNEACMKLIEIFENSLEINMNFDYLLSNVDDLAECNNIQCKRIWLLLAIQIIKFRSDYRTKLFNKMMKIVFELKNKDNSLKIRAIHCASNCCMYIQDLDIKILIEYLTFECLLNEEFQKEYVFVMILNLLKSEHYKISKFLIEFIIDVLVQICIKRFTILRELYENPSAMDEEIKFIKTIFQFFEFYMNFFYIKKNSIIKNIVVIYCFFVNYEREYCWKMMKIFLQCESKNIIKYFLEIVYHNSIVNTYCDLEEYFYYDNDDEFGLTSYFDKIYFFENSHKQFLNKLGDANNMMVKHKAKIIKGSIFFIGMAIWGYERIETLHIPNTIILSHFNKLINHSSTKIDQEIILCLRRLIKKYGETLTDEWNEIFKIIQNILDKDKSSFKDQAIKNLFEILDSIKMLIIQNKFFGKYSDYSQILDELKIFQNESLMLIKCKLKLSNYCSFIANLESVIIEYLINCKTERVRNYLIEIIRLNYSYTFNKNQLVKKSIIENLITKHFSSLVFSLENAENLNFFSLLITEMSVLTTDFKFFDKIIRLILNIHNEIRYYTTEAERSKLIWNFQKNTLISIYNKLSNTFQSEKLVFIHKKIYFLMKSKGDISILITILNFFKKFIINKDYELFIQDNLIYKNKNLPSQIVINFKVNNSKKQKKVYYENFKPKKINIYEPYIVFKHNKVYDFLINLINQDETNTFICEEVLEYLAINLKTTFFYRGLKLEKLLSTIVAIDDIKKYATRKRFIDLIIDILANSTFHLNSNTLVFKDGSTSSTIISANRNSNQSLTIKDSCIEISDDNLKEKIIQFSLNSLKSFINILKTMINTYKKLATNAINSQTQQFQRSDSKTIQPEINFTPINININLITEMIDCNVNNPLSITLKMNVYYIKKMLNLISIYFSSIVIPGNNYFNNLNTKNLFSFYSTASNLQNNSSTTQQNKKLIDFMNSLVDILFEMRNLIFFKLSLGVSILNLILSIKEILIACGEDTILKIIFLTLNIGWPNYENEILKLFSDNFNIKFKKFETEKIRPSEKYMKREYINLLADTCCFYFVEKSSQGKILINIFNNIFRGNLTLPLLNNLSRVPITYIRESIFLDLTKWQIHSKTSRDNLKAEYRSKIHSHAQIYLGKQSIIMIIPINYSTSEVIIRNPISNVNMTVNTNLENDIDTQESEAIDILNNEINNSVNRNVINLVYNRLNNVDPDLNSPSEHKYRTSPHMRAYSNATVSPKLRTMKSLDESDDYSLKNLNEAGSDQKYSTIYDLNKDHIALRRRDCSPNLNNRLNRVNTNISANSISSTLNNASLSMNNINIDNLVISPQNSNSPRDVNNLINNSNIVFQQITNLLCEQDIKFQLLENNSQVEDLIKILDTTPVYNTFNCGVIYVPSKNITSEFDILTYEGEVSQCYVKFLSSLGKVFSLIDNPNIYTGGLNKSGAHGRYSIFYQDNIFQLVFHVSNLIKLEKKENYSEQSKEFREHQQHLNNLRKKLIGNDYVNIVWLENPYQDFDANIIISGASLVYLVVYPISDSHYLLRIKHNKRSRFNLVEKISTYFSDDLCININGQSLSNALIRMAIHLNLMISYILQKTVYKKVEIDQSLSTGTNSNVKLINQIHFDTNITQRFKEIERINCRFKNNTI